MLRIARGLALCLLATLVAQPAVAQPAGAQSVQILHRFEQAPANPVGALVQIPDGRFYAATVTGIIRLSTGGQVTQVARFTEFTPAGGPILASDGAMARRRAAGRRTPARSSAMHPRPTRSSGSTRWLRRTEPTASAPVRWLPGAMGIGATPVPIVVERATYSSPGGAFWSSGGNALATPLP
jgi:hypothetical protein